jgi:uncharacterized membrane protein YeiH
MPVDAATLSGMAITLAVRLAALRWHWKLPKLRDRQTGFD